MPLLADRFLRRDDGWFDIATAQRVQVCVHDAGRLRAQIDWAERGAMLATLRHPLLNPLIDFGAASASSLFEAFALQPPIRGTVSAHSRLTTHGMRFLDAHGVRLNAPLAAQLIRQFTTSSPADRSRPIGIVLQPRRAAEVLTELLAGPLPGGARRVVISAPHGMGLRTLWMAIARRARLDGYVPVCPEALCRWPALAGELAGRHVCLMLRGGAPSPERAAAANLLARAGRMPRAHLCLVAERGDVPRPGTIHLEGMGITGMTSMIYLDPDYGPTEGELFQAARRADGSPARFLAQLGAGGFETDVARVFTVHESTVVYGGGPGHEGPEDTATPPDVPAAVPRAVSYPSRSRIGAALSRAGRRATTLHGRGRHAAAARLLIRAARALEGRGAMGDAGRCWLQLGWIARSRGALERAQVHAAEAARTDISPACQIQAARLTAVCWTDESRLVEAEATLRNLVVAASTLGNREITGECLIALARVLYWSSAFDAALGVLAPLLAASDPPSAALMLCARARTAGGDIPGALEAAREAARRAAAADDLRLQAGARRAMAEAMCAAGDDDGVRTHVAAGLKLAAAGRLPLAMIRLRAILLRALRRSRHAEDEACRLTAMLERARHRKLPALLDRGVAESLAAFPRGRANAAPPVWGPQYGAGGCVEIFLDLAQRAKDDEAAVAEVAEAACQRIGAAACAVVAVGGRVVSATGKPWREGSVSVAQVLASGQRVMFDEARQPPEAAEPIRCGGELYGAIGGRWIAGSVAIPGFVADSLHAAAISIATHLRSLLDAAPAAPPPSAWGELLGDTVIFAALRESIQRAARAPFPVLIQGESGSGKELVARAIHKLSPRHARRFCAINCAALSDELVEAELFGHARGAFTGATTERAGLFEEADGGTLFLDEIGELSGRAQAKLLRVLQEGEVRRVGENLPRRVDVRIVAATNRRLEQEAADGRFRTDLRFRLDVLRIAVPPLRDRVADIPLLAQHFWRHATARVGTQATLGPDALAALSRYEWPGNVRELQNAIAWMAVHAPRRGRVSAAVLPSQLAGSPLATGASFEVAREEFERRFVRAALAQAGGQRQLAAKALGVSRQGLAKMLRRLRIEEDQIGGQAVNARGGDDHGRA